MGKTMKKRVLSSILLLFFLLPLIPAGALPSFGADFQLTRYFSGDTSDWETWGGTTSLVLRATGLDANAIAEDISTGGGNYRWYLSFNKEEELRIDPATYVLHSENQITLRFPTYTCGFVPSYNPAGGSNNGIYYDLDLRVENAQGATVYTASVKDLHNTLTDPVIAGVQTMDGSWKEPGFANTMPNGKKSTCLLFTIKDSAASSLFEKRGEYTWRLTYENEKGRWQQTLSPSAFDGSTLFYFETCLGAPSFIPEKDERYFVSLELLQKGTLTHFAGGTIYGYQMTEDAVFDDTSYKITWVVDGKETVGTAYKGALPYYPGGTPQKNHPDKDKHYEFTGWTPQIQAATGDARYTARFKEIKNTYTVTFKVGQKKLSALCESGQMPTYPYTFEEEFGGKVTLLEGFDKPVQAASGNIVYTASLKEGAARTDYALLTLSRGLCTEGGTVRLALRCEDPVSAFEGLLVYDQSLFNLEKVEFANGVSGSIEGTRLALSCQKPLDDSLLATFLFKSTAQQGCCAVDLLPLNKGSVVRSGYLQMVDTLPADRDQNDVLDEQDAKSLLGELSKKEPSAIDCYADSVFSIKDLTALCAYLTGFPIHLYHGTDATLVHYKDGVGGKPAGKSTQKIAPGKAGDTVHAVNLSNCYTFLGWSDGYGAPSRSDEGLLAGQTFTPQYAQTVPALTLPALHINTGGKAITSTSEYISAKVATENCDDAYILKNKNAEIRGRGNSSWSFERPSYKLRLREKEHLLGLGSGAERDWVLLTTYSDKSLLRNYSMFRLGQMLSGVEYSPDCMFIELYLNGNYRGIYLLCGQVEVSSVRLQLNDEVAQTDKDYLIEMDSRAGGDSTPLGYFTIPNGQKPFVIKSTVNSAAERNFIRKEVSKLNNALRAGDQKEIEKLCDIDSLVDNYILQELSHNRDVGFASFFFYRKDGVFHFGPPWDFDLALGNDREYPNALNEILSEGSRGNAWFSALYEQKWFKNLVKARMAEIDPLIRTMTGELEMMGKALEEGAARTYKAFPVLGHHIFLEPSITAAYKTYPPHVDYLVSWIEQRWTFLRKTIR